MDILMPVNLHIMTKAVNLARERGITVYDSIYLSFAWEISGHLVTADKKLYRKIHDIPGVIYVRDYE